MIKISHAATLTVEDVRNKIEEQLEEVLFDLSMPCWYWDKSKWNTLHIDKIALKKQLLKYDKEIDDYYKEFVNTEAVL
jgi:hypothetical protein